MIDLFVRIGSLGEIHVGRYQAALAHGERVLVRTRRGVELGEILGRCRRPSGIPLPILRPTEAEDEWLIRRLARHRRRAVEQARAELAQAGSEAVLLDVDQIFDGGTLILHFLGRVDQIGQDVTDRVVRRYESAARTRDFARLLSAGCGPGCGEFAGGCETSGRCGSCTGCGVASGGHRNPSSDLASPETGDTRDLAD